MRMCIALNILLVMWLGADGTLAGRGGSCGQTSELMIAWQNTLQGQNRKKRTYRYITQLTVRSSRMAHARMIRVPGSEMERRIWYYGGETQSC